MSLWEIDEDSYCGDFASYERDCSLYTNREGLSTPIKASIQKECLFDTPACVKPEDQE